MNTINSFKVIQSIYNRLDYLVQYFEWHVVQESRDHRDLTSLVSYLWFFLLKMPLQTDERRIIYLWLIVCGSYPKENDIQSTQLYIGNNNLNGLSIFLKSQSIFKKNNCGIYDVILTFPPKGSLLLDVSHTVQYAYTSGIQRVVKYLIQNLMIQKKSICLIEYSECTHSFEVLSEISSLQHTKINKIKKSSFLIFRHWLRFEILYHKIKLVLGNEFIEKIICLKSNVFNFILLKNKLKFLLIYLAIKFKLRPKIIKTNLVVDNVNILFPELITENNRLELWITLLKNMNHSSTMIIYDLIPIYNPEFCVNVGNFVNYLKLLRYVKRVSCISKYVAKSIHYFIANIKRADPLYIQYHYLGSDLNLKVIDTRNSILKLEVLNGLNPIVLCIGSFELRKNQLAVASAAIKLMKEGYKFKMIFFGNPGLKGSEILLKLNLLAKQGFDIITISSGTDELLDAILRQAKFTVFCSLAEGFGLPIVESIFYSKPCLVSNINPMLEISEQLGGCITVNPNSIDNIAEGMRTLFAQDILINKAKWPNWSDYTNEIYNYSMIKPS